MLVYSFIFNGKDITELVSVGAVAKEILSEPLDIGSLHLPFDTQEIEYEMKGFLVVKMQDIENGVILSTKSYDFLIIHDDVNIGDRIGYWKHDLQVMEYSAKMDDYMIRGFAYTKSIKDMTPAPYQFPLYQIKGQALPIFDDYLNLAQEAYLEPIDIKRTYFSNDPFIINKVAPAIIGTYVVPSGNWCDFEDNGLAFIKIKNTKTGSYIDFGNNGYISQTSGFTSDTEKLIISEKPLEIFLENGEYDLEYGYRLAEDTTAVDGMNYAHIPDVDYTAYIFKIRFIDKNQLSIYDLIERIGEMVSKFGGVESKQYYEKTRIFNIDPTIAEYLKSVEAPQTYIQKATLRQTLNTVFSYVNAISRLKYGAKIDTLTMDEFDKITGEFELENISGKTLSRSGSELTLRATSFLERVMPTSLEEPTLYSPASDYYKMVRAKDIEMTETSFVLKLDEPLYKPIRLTYKTDGITITYYDGLDAVLWKEFDFELDLTKRFINVDKWRLKEMASNFPNVYVSKPCSFDAGMAKYNTENLSWKEGDTEINLSEIFGTAFKSQLIVGVLRSAIADYFTLNMIEPAFIQVDNETKMARFYHINIKKVLNLGNFYKDMAPNMLFNLEYISLQDIGVSSERKDINDNFNYYGEAKINQRDKLINIMSQTRGMVADLQRTGQREIAIEKYHESVGDLLKVGMFNHKHRLTITDMMVIMHNEFIQAIYGLSRDFNRKAMFRGLLQEYRWSEIPTSKQVFERNETYTDYLIIRPPDTTGFKGALTKLASGTQEIIFANLFNKTYNDKTKISICYVRTDGMLEMLDDETPSNRHFISTPAVSFGVDSGLVFSFGFNNSMVAGDGIEKIMKDGNPQYFNRAVRYTNEDGIFNKLWFSFKQTETNIDRFDDDRLKEYPLLKDYPVVDTVGVISTGSSNLTLGSSDYLIMRKDSSQILKMTYQLSILPENPALYVFGMDFFAKNYLVKDFSEKRMYLYTYDDKEKYRYGIFDNLKIKEGHRENPFRLFPYNTSMTYDSEKKILKFRFAFSNWLPEGNMWAIGDDDKNLYLACNDNFNGFDSYEYHIRPRVLEIGDYYERKDLLSSIIVESSIQGHYVTGRESINATVTLGVADFEIVGMRKNHLLANIECEAIVNDGYVNSESVSEMVALEIDIDGKAVKISGIRNAKVIAEAILSESYVLSESVAETVKLYPALDNIMVKRVNLTNLIEANATESGSLVDSESKVVNVVLGAEITATQFWSMVIEGAKIEAKSTVTDGYVDSESADEIVTLYSNLENIMIKTAVLTTLIKVESEIVDGYVDNESLNETVELYPLLENVFLKRVNILGATIDVESDIVESGYVGSESVVVDVELTTDIDIYSIIKHNLDGASLIAESVVNDGYVGSESKTENVVLTPTIVGVAQLPFKLLKPIITLVDDSYCREITIKVENPNNYVVNVYRDTTIPLETINALSNKEFTFNHNLNGDGGSHGGMFVVVIDFRYTYKGVTYKEYEFYGTFVAESCIVK